MKSHKVQYIKELLSQGSVSEAERLVAEEIRNSPCDDEAYYWKGNIHHKRGEWKEALESYAEAEELGNLEAAEARRMLMDIIQFYDKERYNV